MKNSTPNLPYVLPFGLYLAFLAAQSAMPGALVLLYPVKTVVVAAALWIFRRHYEDLKPARFSWLAVAVGLIAIVIWVGIDPYYPKIGHSTPLDPSTVSPDLLRLVFLVFRVAGAVLVVPIMEELFWRGFLIRWIDNPDFKRVPIGSITATSAAVTVLLFGLEHEQWLAGMICGALYTGLLYRSRNLFSCVLAHAVSNASLAAWVLARHDWKFW